MWLRDAGRRRSGLVAPPVGLTVAKIAAMAVAGIVVVAICNVDRGNFLPIVGVPWVVPARARRARHLDGAARADPVRAPHVRGRRQPRGGPSGGHQRAPRPHPRLRPVLHDRRARRSDLLLAAGRHDDQHQRRPARPVRRRGAVIGGTSLFGGRGRAIHGLLGGLVIGAIYNGLYLLGLPIQWQLIVTGLVLLAAVSVDSLSRRGTASASLRA